MERKAVGLLSGGLDSILAIRMVRDLGVEVVALTIRLPFIRTRSHSPEAAAEWLQVPLDTAEAADDYIEVLRHPRFGYGRGFNPCIDCRVYMLELARRAMERVGASFVVTGDVLLQRPKSQRPDALHAEDKYSGLDGLILRPLSALLLEPTVPEREGLVDRTRLLAVSGRSRKTQLELAAGYGLQQFTSSAGGCPLTDRQFGNKVRALLSGVRDVTMSDLALLKRGRHFYMRDTHIILGRSQRENRLLADACTPMDGLVHITEYGGPVALVRGRVDRRALAEAARLTVAYSDAPSLAVATVHYRAPTGAGDVVVEQTVAGSGVGPAVRAPGPFRRKLRSTV
jgi:tRNA-specific 2-thiouridylase